MTRIPEWTKDSLLYTAKVKSALGQEGDPAAITASLITRANLHLHSVNSGRHYFTTRRNREAAFRTAELRHNITSLTCQKAKSKKTIVPFQGLVSLGTTTTHLYSGTLEPKVRRLQAGGQPGLLRFWPAYTR